MDKEEESASKSWNKPMTTGRRPIWRWRLGEGRLQDFPCRSPRITEICSDKSTGFIRPRLENGQWSSPFDLELKRVTHKKWRDLRNPTVADHVTAQQDPAGYIEICAEPRGADCETGRTVYEQARRLPPDAPPDIDRPRRQYAHGNELCHHIAYLYDYAGAASQDPASRAAPAGQRYNDQPDGLAGNEDCGQRRPGT